jgi:alkylresorcinol/alkylpyrone synthase
MANITAVGCAVPSFSYSPNDFLAFSEEWLRGHPHQQRSFQHLTSEAGIASRRFAAPLQRILALNGPMERAAIFEQEAPRLAEQAVNAALQQVGRTAAEFGALVFTSCSAPVIPSVDTLLIDALLLPPTVIRVPIYQQGCAGGAAALGLASRLLRGGKPALVVSVELCSLLFQRADLTTDNLVGTALFGDGAACAVIDQSPGLLRVVSSESVLVPNSRHLLGYEIADDGTHLRLSKDLPAFAAAAVPTCVERFLSRQRLTAADVSWWLLHPGGPKILSTLERALALAPESLRWSWEVLTLYGNLSSAAVLFVLARFLAAAGSSSGDKCLLLSLGPGLTIEQVLLEVTASSQR